MLPRKNGKIYATRTLTNCLRFNKRLDMNFLVRKVQEVDILNPLCVSIVEIFESRAMNALVFFSFLVFFRAFVGLSFASSFPVWGVCSPKKQQQRRKIFFTFFPLVTSSRNTQQQQHKRDQTQRKTRARSV